MIKIEDDSVETVEERNGWYLDCENDLWYFNNEGKPIVIFNSDGNPCDFEGDALSSWLDQEDYEPFTRLTGRVIITND